MHRILITSCKGGVGKSTVSIGIATALALLGKRVLLIDFDLGNRSLDLMLGLEDSFIYDICDLVTGRADCESAVTLHPVYPNLAFIGGPFRYGGEMNAEDFEKALCRLDEVYEFDFILIDTSGGAHESVALSAPACDTALIVSSQNPTAIRAAEKSGMMLDENAVETQYLIINGMDMAPESFKKRAGILEMIDRTRTPLLGVVPLDAHLSILSEEGKNVFSEKHSNSRTAFMNIARRICKENVPLLDGFKKIKRKKFLFR
ncbi:MAG: P-loop NTPase [Clostridia bacterium]|nr:P-loop NTPase [Clostridia bacterium]